MRFWIDFTYVWNCDRENADGERRREREEWVVETIKIRENAYANQTVKPQQIDPKFKYYVQDWNCQTTWTWPKSYCRLTDMFQKKKSASATEKKSATQIRQLNAILHDEFYSIEFQNFWRGNINTSHTF